MTPKITKQDVNSFLIDDKGNIYKIISYTNRPTIEVSNIITKETTSFVTGSKALEKFSKLVKEEE